MGQAVAPQPPGPGVSQCGGWPGRRLAPATLCCLHRTVKDLWRTSQSPSSSPIVLTDSAIMDCSVGRGLARWQSTVGRPGSVDLQGRHHGRSYLRIELIDLWSFGEIKSYSYLKKSSQTSCKTLHGSFASAEVCHCGYPTWRVRAATREYIICASLKVAQRFSNFRHRLLYHLSMYRRFQNSKRKLPTSHQNCCLWHKWLNYHFRPLLPFDFYCCKITNNTWSVIAANLALS